MMSSIQVSDEVSSGVPKKNIFLKMVIHLFGVAPNCQVVWETFWIFWKLMFKTGKQVNRWQVMVS